MKWSLSHPGQRATSRQQPDQCLRVGSAELCSPEAACELLICTAWLHQDDFTRFPGRC
jgi:hypothetical protein